MIKTRSAGGIVLRKDLVLIVSQRGTSWSFPKGSVEIGEDDIEAARREIFEESGIRNLKLIKKLEEYQRYKIDKEGKGEDRSEIKTIVLFLFKTNEDILKPVDPHNPEALWVKKDKVVDMLTHPKDKEFFLKILKEVIP